VATLLFEPFVMPNWWLIALIATAALFLTAGHLMIFLSYRIGTIGAVAPFFYTGTIW